MRSTTGGLQRDLRRQVGRAFRGAPTVLSGGSIEKTVAARVTPARGFSLEPERLAHSHALYRRPSGQVDLLEVFDRGAEIRAAGGKWLAIAFSASMTSVPAASCVKVWSILTPICAPGVNFAFDQMRINQLLCGVRAQDGPQPYPKMR